MTANLEEFTKFWDTVYKEHEKGRFVYLLIKKLVEQLTAKPSKKMTAEQHFKDGLWVGIFDRSVSSIRARTKLN